jgi:hypothetical protein
MNPKIRELAAQIRALEAELAAEIQHIRIRTSRNTATATPTVKAPRICARISRT